MRRIPLMTGLTIVVALLSLALVPTAEAQFSRPVAATLSLVSDIPLDAGIAGAPQPSGTGTGLDHADASGVGLVYNSAPLPTGSTIDKTLGTGVITVPAVTPGWIPTSASTPGAGASATGGTGGGNGNGSGNASAGPSGAPAASGTGAASTTSAGGSKYNASRLPFQVSVPGGSDQWWVLNATNYVFATPPSGVDLRVGLTNMNTQVLSAHGGWWDLGGFRCERSQNPPVCVIAIGDLGDAHPGTGYMVYLTTADDRLTILGVSELFEIKPADSKLPTMFTVAVTSTAPGISFVPQATSAAWRTAVRRGVVMLALVVGAALCI